MAEIAIGESRNTCIERGSRPASTPSRRKKSSSCARSSAKVGMIDVAAALERVADRRVEFLDRRRERLVQPVAVGRFHHDRRRRWGGVAGSRSSGRPALPRSPENSTRRRCPPSCSSSRMLAEPRMWPASRKVARIPAARSSGWP